MNLVDMLPRNDLHNHRIIGVDIDNTLIGNSVAKHWLSDFIQKYHKDKEFHLITFRNGQSFERVWDDIQKELPLNDFHFKSLTGMPIHLSNVYFFHKKYKNVAKQQPHKMKRIEMYQNVNWKEIELLASLMLEWKGEICYKLGCSVLLDDMEHLVINGCQKYGIKHYHPNQILYSQGS